MDDKVTITVTARRTHAAFITMLLSLWNMNYGQDNLEEVYAPELRLLPEFLNDLALELDQDPMMQTDFAAIARSQKWSERDCAAIQILMSIVRDGA